MGKSSSESQDGIERQRHAIEARISRLDRRVREDVDTTKDRASGRLSGAKASLTSAGSTAGSKLSTTAGSDSPVAEHPAGLVGAAMAGGAALGFLTGGGDSRSRSNRSDRGASKPSQHEGEGGGIASGVLGSLLGSAQAYIGAQANDVVHSVVDGIKSGSSAPEEPRRKASRVFSGERHLPAIDEEHPGQRDNSIGMAELETETAGAFHYGGRG